MSVTQREFMEIPKFKGGDPFSWLFKVYKFFAFNNTPSHDMVSNSSYYMEGEAHDWFQTLEATGLCTDWVEFICALQDRFRIPINEVSMEAPMEKSFENLVQPIQESNIQEPTIQVLVIKEPPTIQEGNTLEGALAKKNCL